MSNIVFDDLNMVVDNDWAAFCARLRIILDAGADAFAEDPAERSDDPGSVPAWQARAANAVRDWYRDHMIPVVLDHAERSARGEWGSRVRRDAALPGDLPYRSISTGSRSWDDSLPNAAVMMLRQVMSSAVDGVPWSAWLDNIGAMAPHGDSDDGFAWLFDAFRILPVLRTENPHEPEGTWCAADLLEKARAATGADLSMDDVTEALAGLAYHGITSSRFVGGTSGSLHYMTPAATQIATELA